MTLAKWACPCMLVGLASLHAQASLAAWRSGTYTTGYWDCCKPSCAWPGKGRTTAPVRACTADNTTASPNEPSNCVGGGAGTCSDQQPFAISSRLSMGFVAASVSGLHGLSGDANCGQCYELRFTDQEHMSNGWPWGGSHPQLAGKSMVVQVTNIGYDVVGEHSFDLMIP